MPDKIKITQEEFDSEYEITKMGITGDTEATPSPEPEIPNKQDTTPEFLTEEEEAQDDKLAELLNWEQEIET